MDSAPPQESPAADAGPAPHENVAADQPPSAAQPSPVEAGPSPPGPMPGMPMPMPMPGQQPSPEQIAMMQRQLAMEAEKHGMTVPQFVEQLKRQAFEQNMRRMAAMQQQQQQQAAANGGAPQVEMTPEQQQRFQQMQMQMRQQQMQQQQQQQQQQQAGKPQPIMPGPPNPAALALAKFLRGQDLKPRTVILNDERKDMFRVKRALRALQSPAYEKARKKNPLLPQITDRASLENTFKLLPMSMLALRVGKTDPHAGHNHGPAKKAKRVKGLWTVAIVPQQDAEDDMYYVWLWEGSQIMRKVYAALALVMIFLVVLYPLWPLKLRQGVYYLSWGFLGLLGLFFAMAIFRVILFCITYFLVPPGLWLYPNLWEDVSFMDSFRPVWAWHDPNPKKKKSKKAKTINTEVTAKMGASMGHPPGPVATTTATDTQIKTDGVVQRAAYAPPEVKDESE
ncbi:hypothetical protein TD95_000595 [Thielaviopsis punctulata]|uniref:Translocation protein SEC62 n=1 Tax=Thielaviopsis punctulata TaxID=72032 RepID=A0A0F4ZMT2_9PEZI|nr:hypothetical protein TD95_000595 [Thielaviopsis punctulata]